MKNLLLTLFATLAIAATADDQTLSRRAKIKAEIDLLADHPWAGAYCDQMRGIDSGPSYVWMAPQSGAAYFSEGWITESDFGTVSADQSLVRITWENPGRTGRTPTEKELVVVPHNKNIFLVPKTQIHAFCLAARGRGAFPVGLLRRDNSSSPSNRDPSQPALPDQFKLYLDLPPIVANVLRTKSQHRTRINEKEDLVRQTIMIDVGKKHHVFPGMRLQRKWLDQQFALRLIEIKSVRENESNAELRYYVSRNEEIPKIEIGEVYVTTRW